MALGGWLIESVFKFTGLAGGAADMSKFAAATDAASISEARLRGEINSQEAAWMRLSAAQEKAALSRRTAMNEATTRAAGLGFLALAAGIGFAADEAGRLQRAMMSVNIATGFKAPQALQAMVMHVSGMTAQSSVTIAEELAAVASSGINDPKRLASVFPLFAKAADTLFLSPKHKDPTQTVTELTQFAHIFGAYQGKALTDMVNSAAKLMYVQPESIESMIRQGRLFVGKGLAYGVSQDELFDQFMMMGQTGFLKGRGGSGIANYMTNLEGASTQTNHLSKARRAAMMDLHVWDSDGRLKFLDEHGNLELRQSIEYFAKLAKTMPKAEFMTDLQNAFGTQAAAYLAVVTRPAVQQQAEQNRRSLKAIPDVDHMWRDYMGTFLASVNKAWTNLVNVMIDIIGPSLPTLTKMFNSIADNLGRFGDFLNAHPTMAGNLSALAFGMTAFLGSVAAAGAISQALTFLGIIKVMPNALGLVVWPLRFVVTGLWGMATGGTAAGPAIMTTAVALRAAAVSALAAAGPILAIAGGLAAIAGILATAGDSSTLGDSPDITAPVGSPRWVKAMHEQMRLGKGGVHSAIVHGRALSGGAAFNAARRASQDKILNSGLNPIGTGQGAVNPVTVNASFHLHN